MDELSKAFAFPKSEDPDLDIEAIFRGDAAPAAPLPAMEEPIAESIPSAAEERQSNDAPEALAGVSEV